SNRKCEDKSDQVDQKTFYQKLYDEISADGAHDLSDTHFPGSFQRTRRSQVYVIDPGNANNKKCNEKKKRNRLTAPINFCFLVVIRVKMNIAQRKHGYLGADIIGLVPFLAVDITIAKRWKF